MARPVALTDEEVTALRAELQRFVDEWKKKHGKERGALRAVGMELGIDKSGAQQAVQAALTRRFGASMADRICANLGVTREEFMASRRSVAPVDVLDRVLRIGARLGRSATEALVVKDMVLAAYKGETPTDEDIARLFDIPKQAKSTARPATDPGTGGGFAGKLPQRERPPPSDEDDEEPATKINPRRRG